MSRRRTTSAFANPALVGAVTVLVTIVGVFLAYNANSGLPFVPTYELRAVVPDASELTVGNDVRVGGSLVGQVRSMEATERDGRVVAVIEMKLEDGLGPLRSDTHLLIRQRSNVGLKYVELRPGRSGRPLPDGGTLPLRQAGLPVDLDDALGTFDEPTRRAAATLLRDLGGGLAGRGSDLNRSLAALPQTLHDLERSSRLLSDPHADLEGFLDGAASALRELAAVPGSLRRLTGEGAATLRSVARERAAFGRIFDEAAGLERDGAADLHTVRPLLSQATALARELLPGVEALPGAGARLATGLRRTDRPIRRARALARPLAATVTSVRRLSRSRSTSGALDRLTDVVRSVVPTLEHFNPIQTRCNAIGIWTRNVPSVVSEGDQSGTWFRFVPIHKLDEMSPRATPAPDLHYYTVPDAGQQGECEAGNERYVRPDERVIGRVPGVQPGHTEDTPRGTLAERVAAEGGPR